MTKLLLINTEKIQEIQMGQEITIGRAYSNLLRLEGEEVSRVHAILYRRGTEFILRDLDSKNGLLLNGHKVVNCTVSGGDAIQIGKYHVIFEPPAAFDLVGYLRRNRISLPPEVVAAGRDMDTGSGLPPKVEENGGGDAAVAAKDGAACAKGSGDHFSQQSVNFRAAGEEREAPPAGDLAEIYYSLGQIEEMLAAKEADPPPQFSAELIRLSRGMAGLAASTHSGADEESGFTQSLLELVVGVVKADRGVVIFYDTGEVLRLGAIVPRDKDVSVNRVVLRAALREKHAVLCNDAQNDPRFQRTETVRKDCIGSLISYPLVRGETVVGLIYCDSQERANAFREEQLALLKIAGRLLMVTLGLGRPTEAER